MALLKILDVLNNPKAIEIRKAAGVGVETQEMIYTNESFVFWGTGMGCEMKNLVSIRSMNESLFDGNCGGEAEEWERRLMVMASEVGIYWIEDGYVMDLVRCS